VYGDARVSAGDRQPLDTERPTQAESPIVKNRKRPTHLRPRPQAVTSLRPDDLKVHPIWRFVSDDEPDETYVLPAGARRVTRLTGKIVGVEVTLADGSRRWALFSNVDRDSPELTEHFITLSLFIAGRWFHLARYHDVDAREHGPRALAAALRRPISKVFPIRYNLRAFLRNAPPWLEGAIRRSPRQRLSRAQIIALAVPKR
jgi:hypothetical protein